MAEEGKTFRQSLVFQLAEKLVDAFGRKCRIEAIGQR
jgi:hypothetical protein